LQQVGTPEELYEDPINSFVASFIGNPGMNLLPAHRRDNVICISDVAAMQVDGHDCDLHVGVRAEQLALVGDGIPASCLAVEALGSEVQVLVELAGGAKAIVRQPSTSPRPTLGGRVSLALTTPQPLLFDMVTTERIRVPG
jgi:multiple sugar transport system ATP-binding protein